MKHTAIACVLVLFGAGSVFASGLVERLSPAEPEELPAWVVAVIDGDYAALRENVDDLVGAGIGDSEETAKAAAAVDFAGNLGVTVNSEIRERETDGVEGATITIEAEVTSQAVISGIRPLTYRDSRETWYALYRISPAEYRAGVTRWLETVEVMDEARRTAELQRLEEERFEIEKAAEEELNLVRAEELQREARRRLAALEEGYLVTRLQPTLMNIPSAEIPAKGRTATISIAAEDSTSQLSVSWGVSAFEILSLQVFGATDFVGEEVGFPAAGLNAKLRIINGAGVVTRTSVAVGGRVIVYPQESYETNEAHTQGAGYVAGNVRVPQLLHTTYLGYLGTDKTGAAVEWSPFWNGIEDAFTVNAGLELDYGYSRFTSWTSVKPALLVGLGFNPTESASMEIYLDNFNRIGFELEFAWQPRETRS